MIFIDSSVRELTEGLLSGGLGEESQVQINHVFYLFLCSFQQTQESED